MEMEKSDEEKCQPLTQPYVEEYIVPLNSNVLDCLGGLDGLKLIGSKSQCVVNVEKRLLNRKAAGKNWNKYCILRITGKNIHHVKTCHYFINRSCPFFFFECKPYHPASRASTSFYCTEFGPDDICSNNFTLTGATLPSYGGLDLITPFQPNEQRGLGTTHWKVNPEQKSGLFYPEDRNIELLPNWTVKPTIQETLLHFRRPQEVDNFRFIDNMSQALDNECQAAALKGESRFTDKKGDREGALHSPTAAAGKDETSNNSVKSSRVRQSTNYKYMAAKDSLSNSEVKNNQALGSCKKEDESRTTFDNTETMDGEVQYIQPTVPIFGQATRKHMSSDSSNLVASSLKKPSAPTNERPFSKEYLMKREIQSTNSDNSSIQIEDKDNANVNANLQNSETTTTQFLLKAFEERKARKMEENHNYGLILDSTHPSKVGPIQLEMIHLLQNQTNQSSSVALPSSLANRCEGHSDNWMLLTVEGSNIYLRSGSHSMIHMTPYAVGEASENRHGEHVLTLACDGPHHQTKLNIAIHKDSSTYENLVVKMTPPP